MDQHLVSGGAEANGDKTIITAGDPSLVAFKELSTFALSQPRSAALVPASTIDLLGNVGRIALGQSIK